MLLNDKIVNLSFKCYVGDWLHYTLLQIINLFVCWTYSRLIVQLCRCSLFSHLCYTLIRSLTT